MTIPGQALWPRMPRQAIWLLSLALLCLAAVLSSRVAMSRGGGGPGVQAHVSRARLLREASRHPALAFGFRNFLADLLWLRAIQMGESRPSSSAVLEAFHQLIVAVNNYDPRFEVPYILAAVKLGESPEFGDEALETLERGTRALPGSWRLHFYAGYIHYFSLGDPVAGGKSLQAAARIPGSPAYLPLLASRMFAEGSEPQTAISFLTELIREEPNAGRRKTLEERLRLVIVERDTQAMERASKAFREKTGRRPADLAELVASGVLARLPREPHGGRYLMEPSGEIRSDRAAGRLRVFRK